MRVCCGTIAEVATNAAFGGWLLLLVVFVLLSMMTVEEVTTGFCFGRFFLRCLSNITNFSLTGVIVGECDS